jgi:hypothetical protein
MKKWHRCLIVLSLVALLAGCAGKSEPIAEPADPAEDVPTLIVAEEPNAITATESTASPTARPPFCEDPQVMEFVENFISGVEAESGQWIGTMVAESKGLNIRLEWWNTNVHVAKEQVDEIYDDDTVYDWGIADGSGAPVQGTFRDIMQPKLRDVMDGEYVIRCGTLDFGVASGPSAGLVDWPDDIPARHYIAIYRPAPADQDMDWRTWVLGFEFEPNGFPYLTYLVQYHWEI